MKVQVRGLLEVSMSVVVVVVESTYFLQGMRLSFTTEQLGVSPALFH